MSNKQRVGFGPGAEEIEFDDQERLWGVFESGSMRYKKKGRPFVPMLASFDADDLLGGEGEKCLPW